jgi:curved DNA-binding protein CbpA
MSSSFEAALQQVDAHLESLVSAELPQARHPSVAPPAKAAPVATRASSPQPPVLTPSPANTAATPLQPGDPDSPEAWGDFPLDEEVLASEPTDEEAKVRRQRLLQRAMQNLGSSPASTGAAPVESAQSAIDERQLAQLIEKRYTDALAKRDHFTTLGLAIGPEATREQVKSAFLGLAKRFHPDRLPPTLSQLAPKMTPIFEAIREAYEVLYDDAKRAAYLQELRTRAASPQRAVQPGVDPNDLFKMGEVFFRKRDFAAAVDHYERAYNAEPRAVYLAARAWAIYMDPQRKADIPKAKQLMAEALKMDPRCDRAHYQLGVIARVENDVERAERHFREAVRANPKHLEANQELRLIEMRKKNPQPPAPKKGGLFR